MRYPLTPATQPGAELGASALLAASQDGYNNTTTKQKTAGAGEDVQKLGPSYTVGGNEKWCSHDGERYGRSPQKVKNRTAT